MKDLKCKHCGAVMKLDDDKEFATCTYCGTKYKLNEDKNINIKLDEGTKNILNNGLKTAGKVWIFSSIPFILVFIIILIISGVIIFNIVNFNKNTKTNDNSQEINNTQTKIEKQVEETISKQEIERFNSDFEFYAGTKWKNSIELLLDKVVKNNRKNSDKIITVVYRNNSVTDGDAIIDLKHSLEDFKDYEVKVDYNDTGYINKVIIEDI